MENLTTFFFYNFIKYIIYKLGAAAREVHSFFHPNKTWKIIHIIRKRN
jgi:hypothetical protein